MTSAAKKLVLQALDLSEDERLEMAAELLASVEGPGDSDWESAWLEELERRRTTAESSGELGPEWSEVRSRLLRRLASV